MAFKRGKLANLSEGTHHAVPLILSFVLQNTLSIQMNFVNFNAFCVNGNLQISSTKDVNIFYDATETQKLANY